MRRRPTIRRCTTATVVATLIAALLATLTAPTAAMAQVGGEEASGSAGIALIAQSPWIADDGDLALELRVTGDVAGTVLRVGLHEAVDRRGLASLHDDVPSQPLDAPVEVALDAALNSAGVASLVLTVGPDGQLRSRPGGVYPLVVELFDSHGLLLDRLITPLVHLPVVPAGEAVSHRPLLVGLTVDVVGPPALRPDGRIGVDASTVRQLEGLVRAILEHPAIPIDVGLPPSTIDGLARSDELAHARLLADLVQVAGTEGFHLRSTPYVTADPTAWLRADRADVHRDLLDHGDRVLAELLGISPDRSVALLGPTAVPETLDLLGRLGAERLVVSANHLDPRPVTASHGATHPARLIGDDGGARAALVADPDLAQHLVDPWGAVSAAQFLLADLALLAWADLTVTRAAIITTPPGLPVDGEALHLVMGALRDAPFLRVRPLPLLFDAMRAFDAAAAVTYELWPEPVVPVDRRATDRSLAETAVAAYTAMLGGPHPDAAALHDLLEATAATELDADALDAYLQAVYARVTAVLEAFTAPTDQDVRLTGRRADVPFTVHNGLDTPARVVVALESDGRLEFPDGDTLEVVLEPGRNRLALPVQARTSAAARLQVTIRSPDEARLLQLRSTDLVVRTTSLPGVGVALFIGALAVLALWWIRATRVRFAKPTGGPPAGGVPVGSPTPEDPPSEEEP
ncbi:MAG: DUF6049 family protein [Actinomycetota bacterium]|nr:DUF6049 family protein [Actinomycetota bacterium]